jgi:uncharacterized protein (TIGR00369 family)
MDDTVKRYGVVASEELKSYDGVGFLKAMIAGVIPQPPMCELLGFRLIEVDNGRAVFEGVPGFQHYNPFGVVHGGLAATMLDSALGCAVHSTLPAGDGFTTLELKVNLVRAISKDTGPLRAEARVLHRGRTVATADADLKDNAGKLYAHASTTCMIFPAQR